MCVGVTEGTEDRLRPRRLSITAPPHNTFYPQKLSHRRLSAASDRSRYRPTARTREPVEGGGRAAFILKVSDSCSHPFYTGNYFQDAIVMQSSSSFRLQLFLSRVSLCLNLKRSRCLVQVYAPSIQRESLQAFHNKAAPPVSVPTVDSFIFSASAGSVKSGELFVCALVVQLSLTHKVRGG